MSQKRKILCWVCKLPLRPNAVHARVLRGADGEIIYVHSRPRYRGADCYDKVREQFPSSELERLRRVLKARGVIVE